MKQENERSANLSLMVKFDQIESRQSPQRQAQKTELVRKPKLHDFTDFQLQEIIQSNRILADRLDCMSPSLQIKDNSDHEMYLASQLSKFNKKEQLVNHFNKLKELRLPTIQRVDTSIDQIWFRNQKPAILESIVEEKLQPKHSELNDKNKNTIMQINLNNREFTRKINKVLDWQSASVKGSVDIESTRMHSNTFQSPYSSLHRHQFNSQQSNYSALASNTHLNTINTDDYIKDNT